MPYFSRLTDIVTCNLTSILRTAEDPTAALDEIIFEIKEGIAGATRSVTSAERNVAQIETEIAEQRAQISHWLKLAEEALAAQDDHKARLSLQRKHEVEDLIAGLEHQLHAAVSTRDHLKTMRNALEARLADAKRRRDGESPEDQSASSASLAAPVDDRQSRIDAELEALRKSMNQ